MSAPNSWRASRRVSARSMATMWLGREQPGGQDRRRGRSGPAPTMATTSPGRTCRRAHRPRRPWGGCRPGRGPARRALRGHLVDGVVGERHPRVLGLESVDHVPEDPAAAAQALAVAGLLAEAAAPAGADARHQHAVADSDARHAGADLLDGADRLVAEHASRAALGHVALEDVQVGPADRRGCRSARRRRSGPRWPDREPCPACWPGPW